MTVDLMKPKHIRRNIKMTVQAKDYVMFRNQEFVLIDVESGKQIICCADFVMPKPIEAVWSSACQRGYTANYTIRDGKLYGIRCECDEDDNFVKSNELPLNFTGSCVIASGEAGGRWGRSDFLECYLDFDKAFELHFTNGNLDEERCLSEAIAEMREIETTAAYKSEDTEPIERSRIRKEIARKHLKYAYDRNSYKWRPVSNDILPVGSKVRLATGEIAYIGCAIGTPELDYYDADIERADGKRETIFVDPEEIAEVLE